MNVTINMLCYLPYNRNTLEEVERYIDKSIHSYDSFIGQFIDDDDGDDDNDDDDDDDDDDEDDYHY